MSTEQERDEAKNRLEKLIGEGVDSLTEAVECVEAIFMGQRRAIELSIQLLTGDRPREGATYFFERVEALDRGLRAQVTTGAPTFAPDEHRTYPPCSCTYGNRWVCVKHCGGHPIADPAPPKARTP